MNYENIEVITGFIFVNLPVIIYVAAKILNAEQHDDDTYAREITQTFALIDKQLDRKIERNKISNFSAWCECPDCKKFDLHFISKVNGKYVTRECRSLSCGRKWKQER